MHYYGKMPKQFPKSLLQNAIIKKIWSILLLIGKTFLYLVLIYFLLIFVHEIWSSDQFVQFREEVWGQICSEKISRQREIDEGDYENFKKKLRSEEHTSELQSPDHLVSR